MPWDESSLPSTLGPVNSSSVTVKVKASDGQGPTRGGGGTGGVCTPRSPSPLATGSLSLDRSQGQSGDPGSLLSLFRWLSDLRGKERSLLHGDFHALSSGPDLFSYIRQWDQNERFLIVLNFGDVGQPARLGASNLPSSVDLLLSTQPGRKEGTPLQLEHLNLEPYEGLLLRFPYVA